MQPAEWEAMCGEIDAVLADLAAQFAGLSDEDVRVRWLQVLRVWRRQLEEVIAAVGGLG